MSSVTHELRTPLTSIRALSEMLFDDPKIRITSYNVCYTKLLRQLFAFGEHVLDALVRGIASGEHLAVQQQHLARLP